MAEGWPHGFRNSPSASSSKERFSTPARTSGFIGHELDVASARCAFMRRRHIKYLGYAVSVVAGLLIATGTGPKVLVLAIVAIGVALILVGDRASHRTKP